MLSHVGKEFKLRLVYEEDGSHFFENDFMRLTTEISNHYRVDYKKTQAVDATFYARNHKGHYQKLFDFTALDHRDAVLCALGYVDNTKNFLAERDKDMHGIY